MEAIKHQTRFRCHFCDNNDFERNVVGLVAIYLCVTIFIIILGPNPNRADEDGPERRGGEMLWMLTARGGTGEMYLGGFAQLWDSNDCKKNYVRIVCLIVTLSVVRLFNVHLFIKLNVMFVVNGRT